MKEIEVKILDIDPKEVVAKLKKLKAKKVEEGLVSVKAYDFPDGRLLKDDSFIRVRRIGDRVEVIFKKENAGRFKVSEEIEIVMDDFETACTLFERLGMKLFADHEKYRASYKIGAVKIEFDKLPGIPWFFEVEAESEKGVEKAVALLGFDMRDSKKVTGKMIQEIYGIKAISHASFAKKRELPNYAHLFR
jgi:adenylate cyclase class 2